jgi:hypothetical protein
MSALAFAGASAGLSLLSGLFGYMAAEDAAEVAESRGRLLRVEAEADAERYAEQARGFKATQKLAYLKSGVELEGSPLDILDETARVASENISAMRARGQAQQIDAEAQAGALRGQGRAGLIGSVAGGISTLAQAGYRSSKNAPTQTPGDTGIGYRSGRRTVVE